MSRFIPLGELIADLAARRGLSTKELAQRSSLPTTVVASVLTGSGNFASAAKCAGAMGKKVKATHAASRKDRTAEKLHTLTGPRRSHLRKKFVRPREFARWIGDIASPFEHATRRRRIRRYWNDPRRDAGRNS